MLPHHRDHSSRPRGVETDAGTDRATTSATAAGSTATQRAPQKSPHGSPRQKRRQPPLEYVRRFIAIFPGDKRPSATGSASVTIRLDDACSCTDAETCHHCLLTRAAEAACSRRVAHDYLGTCAMNGRHYDAATAPDCPNPNATIAPPEAPAFCAHAKTTENCIVHAPRRPEPAKLARCRSCFGYHGKTGRDRCPYTQKEAAAVKASRTAAMKSAETPEASTGSRKPPVADSAEIQPNDLARLPGTISHLGNAARRLRRKPGRPATGTSKWAGLRKTRKDTA